MWDTMWDPWFIGFIGILAWLWLTRSKMNFPPGPLSLPIIGSVIQVALQDHEAPFVALHKLSKKYGNIMSVKLGSVRTVVVSGFDAIKDMQTNQDFMSRLDDKWLLDKTGGIACGLLLSKADYWSETRRICYTLLRPFGFGQTQTIEPLVIEELKVFSEELKTQIEKRKGIIEISDQFQTVYMNIVWNLVTGTRFEHDDPKLHRILELNRMYAASGQIGGGIVGLFPEVINYAPDWTGYTHHKNVQHQMRSYMEDLIASYRKIGTYKTEPTNFVECFLQEIDNHGGPWPDEKTLDEPYSDLNLVGILTDFALAGSDTSASTTNFAVRYLVQNPEIQDKMRREIDQVLGRDRWVSLNDKADLKYSQAFILETLRISSVVPLVPRKTHKNCTLGKYDIPEGMLILPNIWSANMNEDVWEKPYIFDPERFLDINGNVANSEKILTFGIGRRNCIGEGLAKTSLLITLVSLVQQFLFEVDPATGVPADLNTNKFGRNTVPYKILIKRRY